MKRSALPRPIKSKNPVVILRAVIKAIQEEPKRYDQFQLIDKVSDYDYEIPDPEYFPTCGTVGCVAGWTALLTSKTPPRAGYLTRARRVLKLTEDEANELFDCNPPDVRPRHEVTPRQHVNDGVKHIKRFVIKKWGKKL